MVPVAKLPVAAMRLAGATGPSGIKPSGCAADCAGDDEPVPGAKCKQVVLSVTVSKSSKKRTCACVVDSTFPSCTANSYLLHLWAPMFSESCKPKLAFWSDVMLEASMLNPQTPAKRMRCQAAGHSPRTSNTRHNSCICYGRLMPARIHPHNESLKSQSCTHHAYARIHRNLAPVLWACFTANQYANPKLTLPTTAHTQIPVILYASRFAFPIEATCLS